MVNSIDNLTIMNDFLFCVVMRQEQYCKPLMEYILRVKIRKISYITEQESIVSASPTAKSIRLDVFVEDDQGTVYDIEVQTTNQHNLGKRSRYYQSMMDIRVLDKGEDYKKLKKSFVIFICSFDPFGRSRYIYTFQNRCSEDMGVLLDDDATKIIVNTQGTLGDISDELKAVLRYMDSGITTTDYTKALDEEVSSVKSDEKVRSRYMMLQEAYARERRFGSYEQSVKLIRSNMKQLGIADLARILLVSPGNCKSVISAIRAHPDWDDEMVAEEIVWDD